MPQTRTPKHKPPKRVAIIGAGMAGIACARTLAQAGHDVTVFEQGPQVGGRMASVESPFGSFDSGAQYFTVRDARFARALETVPGLCKPWSANTVRVLDGLGRVAAAGLPAREAHWVATPGMRSLVAAWAEPLASAGRVELQTRITHIERDALHPAGWQLRSQGADDSQHVYSSYAAVLLALPAGQARELLASVAPATAQATKRFEKIAQVQVAPCWTLMLAFPQAMQANITSLGPQWNAARSTHHRVAWLARESSKPGRGGVERWTVQASAQWSAEHLSDDPARVQAKLQKAFSEITGIRAEPAFATTTRWVHAQTQTPLGQSHLWDGTLGIGACGDWCLGHRVENAFVSGLELALAAM